VIEEICRVRGYDRVPRRLPDTVVPGYRPDPRLFEDTIRDLLSGRGLAEVVTNGLIGPHDHARLGYAADDAATIRVANPVTVDHSELRRSMLPGLLAVLARNERQRQADVAIFECGNVHEWRDSAPHESRVVAILLAGHWRAPSWSEPARVARLEDLKGLVEALTSRLHVGRITYTTRGAWPGVEHPGRGAAVTVRSDDDSLGIGVVFEVHPRLLQEYDIRADRAVFAVLELEQMRATITDAAAQVRRIDHLPQVERDLAVIVGSDVAAGDVAAVIAANAGPLLSRLDLFDRYEGPPLGANELSLAYRMRFQPADAPLSEVEIEETMESIRSALAREVGGRIRSGS